MTSTPIEQLVAQLRAAQAQHPELADHLNLHADLLAAGMAAAVSVTVPEVSAEEAQARCAAGAPLLRAQDIPLNSTSLWQTFERVCAIASQRRPDLAGPFDELLALSQNAPCRLKASMRRYLVVGEVETGAAGLTQQEELLVFAFSYTLRPVLRACAERLAPQLSQELWQRGACPICGGEPDFALLDDKAGTRYLVCSRCDTRWLYPRVKCPFCDTSDPSDLAYYPWEDGRYRLYTCGACRRYLKAMDMRQAGAQGMPAEVARVLTVDMDVAAREEGYC
jgi:FdhE protein